MKRIIIAAGLVLLAASLPAQVLDMPVAVVRLTETVNIGRRELTTQLELFSVQLGRSLTVAEQSEILDALVNDELLLQAAARSGIRVTQAEISNYLEAQRQQYSQLLGAPLTDEQFRQVVQQQTGSTWTEYVQDVSNEVIKLTYVQTEKAALFDEMTAPSAEEIERFYEEQATAFTNPAMVRFHHIYVDLRGLNDQQRADGRLAMDALSRQLRSGLATFDSVSRQALENPAFSAADFGYLMRNDAQQQALLGRSFVDRVFQMDNGDVSGVMESNVALHIVLIVDKRGPRILSLDDPLLPGQNATVRDQISGVLYAQKEQELLGMAVDEIVQDLRREADVTIFENNVPW